jgi:hypothetical protein
VKGQIEIAIRDRDQTVVGNPGHELMRPGLSLATAARGAKHFRLRASFPSSEYLLCVLQTVKRYRTATLTVCRISNSSISPPEVFRALQETATDNEEHSIGSAHVRKLSKRKIGRREHCR